MMGKSIRGKECLQLLIDAYNSKSYEAFEEKTAGKQ